MTDDMSSQPDASERDEQARRQAALRALAQSAPQQPTGAPPPVAASPAPAQPERVTAATRATTTPATTGARSRANFSSLVSGQRPPSRRRGVLVGVALALVVVVVVAAAFGARALLARQAATQPKPITQINALQDGLSCITQVAWTPDSKQVAALGNTEGCGGSQSDSQTGAVFIYDAQSNKLLQQLQPDLLVYKAPAIAQMVANEGPSGSTSLYYFGMTWAPDGQSLLLPFSAFGAVPQGQNGGSSPQVFGLLRLGASHKTTSQVWISPVQYFQQGKFLRWDLTTGTSALVPAPATATALRWTADDGLVAANVTSQQPIGTPDGGQTFTIWQPGFLSYDQYQASPNTLPTEDLQNIIWGANFGAVSPDGHYLGINLPTFGSLVPPSTKQDFTSEPKIAPRDKALLGLAQRMTLATKATAVMGYEVAWRPDGRLLAATATGGGQGLQSGPPPLSTVVLYDTASGKLLAHLSPPTAGLQEGETNQAILSWSPDGKRLLLIDNLYGAITIWGPGALPA